jgi:uncharacterized phage protein (TIGR02216 family)
MAAGLGVLRFPPAHFWSMTPRELVAALDGAAGRHRGPPPLGRPGLDALMRAYPDATP